MLYLSKSIGMSGIPMRVEDTQRPLWLRVVRGCSCWWDTLFIDVFSGMERENSHEVRRFVLCVCVLTIY